jgi:hypothetical protein
MNTLLTKMVDLIETTIVTGWKKIFKDDLVFGVGSIFGDRLD